MANQRAQMHDIPLKTMDLNLNKFSSEISPYSGFNKNNGPFYGNVLSPFYSRKTTGVGKKSFVSAEGDIYRLDTNGNLYAYDAEAEENIELLKMDTSKAITKETKYTSGNTQYPTILGFVEPYSGSVQTTPDMLCSSIEGAVALISNNGTLIKALVFDEQFVYKPGSKVHFVKKTANGRIIFAYGNQYFWEDSDTVYTHTLSATSEYSMSSYCFDDDNVLFCCKGVSANKSELAVQGPTVTGTNKRAVIKSVVGALTGDSITVNNASGEYSLFSNSKGNVLIYGLDFNKAHAVGTHHNYDVYNFGNLNSITKSGDDYVLNIALNETSYCGIANLSTSYLSTLTMILDDYSLYAVLGNNTDHWIHVGNKWGRRRVPNLVMSIATPWKTYQIVLSWKEEDYIAVPAHDELVSGQYSVTLLDGVTQDMHSNVGVLSNGTYQNGLFAEVGNYFRVLYNNGEATAVSVTSDQSIMGSLVCGYTELNSTYPICHGDLSNGEFFCYKNVADEWQIIKLINDVTKFDLTIIDNRYLLINTNNYYNCYDTKDRKPCHFSPDYNNRAIQSASYSGSSSPTSFAAYIAICEQWNVGSGQGSNYIALNTPFISALFAQQILYYPKNVTSWDVIAPGSYTPDNIDIDIYRSKMVDGNALYVYSIDQSANYKRLYINSNLTGTSYSYMSSIYIPTIFAKFINGFINQGIIIDNGHSYLQLYANNTKPVFGIRLVDQLEGVTAACIIQGQYFVVINKAIYRYDPSNYSTTAIVNIGNMELIGYTPYQALFWSETNKTFYTFTGDNTLNVLVQANEIESIIATAYNPNTMSMYILTDDSIYIFSTDQLIRLELKGYEKVFSLNTGAVFVGQDALYISYNKLDGYDIMPIELETKLYGEGNSLKSVNDCVYIRLFDDERKAGQIKLRCTTLNEGIYKSEEKVFAITKEMWDKNSNTLFLRYQPRFQACTGFSVKIVSPFAIATLQISSSIETVQNAKYNQ